MPETQARKPLVVNEDTLRNLGPADRQVAEFLLETGRWKKPDEKEAA